MGGRLDKHSRVGFAIREEGRLEWPCAWCAADLVTVFWRETDMLSHTSLNPWMGKSLGTTIWVTLILLGLELNHHSNPICGPQGDTQDKIGTKASVAQMT